MNSSTRSLRDIAQLASDRLGGVRGRALDREAKKLGLTLSYTTVDKILAGTYTSRPTRPTLDALAQLSGVTPSEVYAAAGAALPMKPLADQLPPDVDTLTSEQRRIVIDLARVFVKQNQHERELQQLLGSGSNEDQDKPQTNPPSKRTLRAVGPSRDAGQGQKTAPGISGDAIRHAASRARNNLLKAADDRPDVISKANLDKLLSDPEWYRRVKVPEDMLMDPTAMRRFREILLGELGTRQAMREVFDQRPQAVEEHLTWLESKFQEALRNDPAFLIPPPIEQLAAHPYFKTEHEKFEEQYGERGEEDQSND